MLSLTVLVSCAGLLISGSPLLGHKVTETVELPLGTLVAWAGLFSLPSTIYLGLARQPNRNPRLSRSGRSVLLVDLVLALSWGWVAYGLAGNWRFAFSGEAPSFRGSEQAYSIFWTYSVVIVLLALVALILLLASRGIAAPGSGRPS